ncbi:hypothetical protein [Pelagerythrobacter rhizovicinus]|uniref:Uncharacterized protein n=1 Tax=Pelagerythrobacter rhizovicinus TaxID=2268576 RepID=A0A4Q2KL41_9SPHN|nr:hypothetical protein [Pelagerythrobacter rhizovicinus]RXZ66034.1 hypothetical protein ETX26_04775 [Pelagerythrobacter rhizovicinus]
MRVSLLILGVGIAMVATPSLAGKKEDAYAKCAWDEAPVSAANWLTLPVPAKYPLPGNITREYALKQRLDAACLDRLIAEGISRPRALSAKKLRAALEQTRPAELVLEEEDPKAFVCFRYFENDTAMKNPAAVRWGYGRDMSKSQFGTTTSIFAEESGGGVSLSEDGGLEKCQFVRSDGSLVDA